MLRLLLIGSTCLAFVRLGPSHFRIRIGVFAALQESTRVLVYLVVCSLERRILLCQRRGNSRLALTVDRYGDYVPNCILQERAMKDPEVLLVLILVVLFLELLHCIQARFNESCFCINNVLTVSAFLCVKLLKWVSLISWAVSNLFCKRRFRILLDRRVHL